MGEVKVPDTVVKCAGTGDDLNLLEPHLLVSVRAQRDVLVSEDLQSGGLDDMGTPAIYLGTKAGRGVNLRFKNFDALAKWVGARKGLSAKLEPHREDEIYVPEDNPDDGAGE